MARPNRRAALLDILSAESAPTEKESLWDALVQRIRQGRVLPILSNSVRCDHIFDLDATTAGGPPLPSDELLAASWARRLGYPFPNGQKVARIAGYNRVVNCRDAEQAKTQYLAFLKRSLLALARQLDPDVEETVEELLAQVDELSFADLVTELDYPRFASDDEDSLRLLARLPLPIYVTTSPHDFMERALRSEGRENFRTQICFWQDDPVSVQPEHRADPTYVPTPEEPVVYYLFGHEAYPSTLVLSEDDHLDFLVKIAQYTSDTQHPIIPLYLRSALANSSLLLLGYRLQNWDFRILFRMLIRIQQRQRQVFSMALQLEPAQQEGIADADDARHYLDQYFKLSDFDVVWNDTDSFVGRLWKEWHRA